MNLTWPVPVKSGKYEESIALGTLSQNQKHLLWGHLKSHHPEIAAYLTVMSGDEGFLRLMSEFDGDMVLEARYFPPELRESLVAGIKNNF